MENIRIMEKILSIYHLTGKLNQYRHEYYNLNNPSISDTEYDRLFDKLKLLESETGVVIANSPTQTVGYETISKFEKVKHEIPLLSLNKTKSIEELSAFAGNNKVILMHKTDGLTVKLEYENGLLQRGSTRGNGQIGENVTHNVKRFRNLPISIPYKGKLTIVGEAVILKSKFDEINLQQTDEQLKYKNPRNLVAGSVRQQDSQICAERGVCFQPFDILEIEDSVMLSDSKRERLQWLQTQGFWSIFCTTVSCDLRNLEIAISQTKAIADQIGLPIDGLVLTFDSVEYSKSLGTTSHHPLHSMAFKFEDEVAETTLTEIEWSVGRTGTITPVAIFEPVELDGTEVARASLHNLSIMEELELGIGDTISIIKANQIIPQVVDNLTRSNNIELPMYCPSCDCATIIQQLNDSKVLKCVTSHCPAQLLGRFSHFVSRNAMNIEGLSEATLEKFIEQGFVRRFSDIYQLVHFNNEIISMEGFGVKSFNKLQESIKKSINVKMENFLYGLGIPHIGRSASKTIAKHFNGDWFAFEEAIVSGFNFTALEDFGQVMHDSIIKWYLDADEHYLWDVVTVMLIFEQEKKETKSNNLKDLTGTTFVITGSVNTFKNRDEFKELVESLGGKVSGSVSTKTDYLVSNEASGSSKSKKAAELGVKVITEIEFNEMIGRSV